MKDFEKMVACMIAVVVFFIGMRVGYNTAMKDAKLIESNSASYTIQYGEGEHAFVYEYSVD